MNKIENTLMRPLQGERACISNLEYIFLKYQMEGHIIHTMGLRGKQNIFQIGDFMALGSSFRHD